MSVILILALTAEVVLARWSSLFTPHFIYAILLAFGLAADRRSLLFWLVAGGLALDLSIGTTLGLFTTLFSISAITLHFLQRSFLNQSNILFAFVVFLVLSLVFDYLLAVIGGGAAWQIIVPAGLTACIAVLFYQLVLRLSKYREVIGSAKSF